MPWSTTRFFDQPHTMEPTGCPLVDGTTPAERGSGVSAMRSARAKALKIVSHWWCAFSPFRVVDVQRDAGVVAEPLEELEHQLRVEAADHAGLEGHVHVQPRAAGKSTTTRDSASSSGT